MRFETDMDRVVSGKPSERQPPMKTTEQERSNIAAHLAADRWLYRHDGQKGSDRHTWWQSPVFKLADGRQVFWQHNGPKREGVLELRVGGIERDFNSHLAHPVMVMKGSLIHDSLVEHAAVAAALTPGLIDGEQIVTAEVTTGTVGAFWRIELPKAAA